MNFLDIYLNLFLELSNLFWGERAGLQMEEWGFRAEKRKEWSLTIMIHTVTLFHLEFWNPLIHSVLLIFPSLLVNWKWCGFPDFDLQVLDILFSLILVDFIKCFIVVEVFLFFLHKPNHFTRVGQTGYYLCPGGYVSTSVIVGFIVI